VDRGPSSVVSGPCGASGSSLPRPAVVSNGPARDPSPPQRGVRTLKGAKAGRLVRALCDWKSPVGVRKLARRAGVDAGYATRVLTLLEDENVLERGERGEIALVRWRELLGLWARDYEIGAVNRHVPCLSPRGLESFTDQLRLSVDRYALTGLIVVALSQCVVDLLTGAGREPAQAAALLDWMEENEDAWRLP